MEYYSLNGRASKVSFREAVLNGIAPDKGLYFPENIPKMSSNFIKSLENYSKEEIAYHVIKPFVGSDISKSALEKIIENTVSFDFPIKNIENNISTLELFHGPTMAFKDVGASFLAQCIRFFNDKKSTVLVATSGDTGGAVANGFYNVEGVDVVILYPSKKVSLLQEKQLTTLGKNITAIEVNGTFDDCQNIVKKAFLDRSIKANLTSANSINIARWLPQMFYFFFAYKELLKSEKEIVFSVPSGNFGNVCAGLLAKKIGLPIRKFIAATNSNATIPNFLDSNKFVIQPTIATISNAMDVSNPSNFPRILELFQNNVDVLKDSFASYSFSDKETKAAMQKVYKQCKYVLDPHGAVGYLALKKQTISKNQHGIFLETAHPLKFLETVASTLQRKLTIPENLKRLMQQKKVALKATSYEDVKSILNK